MPSSSEAKEQMSLQAMRALTISNSLAMGSHMNPRMHKKFNRTPALPSLCLSGWMSWYCLTERHCPAVCPGLGRRHSWRGGTHHAVWSGVSY